MFTLRWMLAALSIVLMMSAAQAKVRIRLAHELPVSHYGHVYIERWAKLVNERSGGEITVQVFPSGQLYKDADGIQAISSGGLDMQLAVASYLSAAIPAMRLIDLPYLTRTPYDLPELLDTSKPLGSYLNARAKEKGFNILSWWAAGDVMLLSSKRPIKTRADIQGLTVRVIGGGPGEAAVKALGAEPIHLSPVQLVTAVNQGTVQGFESTYSYWKTFPTMKYGTNVGTLAMLGYAVLISNQSWARLSAEQRALIQDTLAQVTAEEIAGVKTLDQTDRAALAKLGRQIDTLAPDELQRWHAEADKVYAQFGKEIGPQVMELLEQQRATMGKK